MIFNMSFESKGPDALLGSVATADSSTVSNSTAGSSDFMLSGGIGLSDAMTVFVAQCTKQCVVKLDLPEAIRELIRDHLQGREKHRPGSERDPRPPRKSKSRRLGYSSISFHHARSFKRSIRCFNYHFK
jgi:hypothetical protein